MVVGYSPTISEGDLTPENVSYCTVKKDERVQTRKGHFSMNDMIGQPYGTKIRNTKGDGFVYLLHPTPELWTLVLKHRTQILYFPDIAFITTMLDLKNGSVVVESGTGSGSFSHSLIRTIAPQGHLYTFEYHEQRANAARQEFEEHKLTDFVTIEHRDVCTNGFDLKDKADADLPSPWEAIETSKEALRKDKLSKICCFSPCIEQVQKTVLKLNELGFKNITMYECLIRNYETKTIQIKDIENGEVKSYVSSKPTHEMRGHTSYLTFADLIPVVENV